MGGWTIGGAAFGIVSGAAMGFIAGGPVGAVVGGVIGGASGGLQGYQHEQAVEAGEKQVQAQEQQGELAKQANYRTAVAAIQQAARGLTTQALRKSLDEKELADPAAMKRKHTPYQMQRSGNTQGTHAEVREAFLGLRGTRSTGKPVS